MLQKHLLSLGIEMIDPQHDGFGERLESVIAEIKTKIDDGIYKSRSVVQNSAEVKKLESMILDRIKMKVSIKVNAALPAAVIPFYSNPSNIFLHRSLHNQGLPAQQKRMKDLVGQRGTVDNRKAVLGGFFSDVEVLVFMDFVGLFELLGATVREVTAFLLHELGHGYYAFEYADRLSSTNQVMAAAALAFNDNDPKTRELLYVELQKIDKKVSKDEVAKLVSENRIIAGKKLYTMLQTHVESQLKDSSYDRIAFEQMADNFANRFGYGRDIVTGLEKFKKVYGDTDTALNIAQYFTLSLTLLGLGGIVTGSFILGAFYMILFGWILANITGDSSRVNTYDDVKKVLITRISDLDAIIEKTPISRTILDGVANLVLAKDRDARASMIHQQQLENLSSNDIFLKSSQLV